MTQYKCRIITLSIVVVAVILIGFFIFRFCNQIKSDSTEFSPQTAYRLPTNLIPINYELKVQPYMLPEQLVFNGSVLILINCNKSTRTIRLNVNKLELDNDKIAVHQVNEAGESEIELKVKKIDLKDEELFLKLNQDLKENKNYTLFISFKGDLKISLTGFYKSSYTDLDGQTKYSALAHFEPTFARWAFPCWDEPAFKATFDIEITHWKNMTALSNMPNISSEIVDSDWIKTKFMKTVKMSTYLVTYAIGEFAFEEDLNNVPAFRIVTRPSEIKNAKAAIDLGPKILAFHEDYFGIKFPLTKIDLLATPDFSSGATEDYGLILFRESLLLDDGSSITQLYLVCSVIAHELTHQWFGNLVTMKYWDDLWLNEGFATWRSYSGSDHVKPEWDVFERFVLDEVQDVMRLDSLRNSHPISVKVDNPSEINQIFDRISYAKAASIIRMMSYFIGEENFQEGLHNYLNAFKYSNADQSDLWRYLQDVVNKRNDTVQRFDVKKVMDSWTLQKGYPLVRITRNYKSNSVLFSQQRFLLNSNAKDQDKLIKTQYEVPITYTTRKEQNWHPTTRLWLHSNLNGSEIRAVQNLNFLSNDDWLVVNLQEVGFYRVTYDDKNWNLLIDQLHTDPSKINRINRVQILDDLFHLAENGNVNYTLALRALEYLKNEIDTLPWSIIDQLTSKINMMLSRSEEYGQWQKYVRNLIEEAYNRFKLEELGNENLKDNQMQKAVTSTACYYGLDHCVDESKKLFDFMKSEAQNPNRVKNTIPKNVRQTVYCTAIREDNDDDKNWNFIFELYLKEQNANERNIMLSALTCTRTPHILNHYLKLIFDDKSGIKSQDREFVFKQLASQNYAKEITFSFLSNNWEHIQHQLSGKQFDNIFKWFDHMNSASELDKMKKFYRQVKHKVGSSRPYLQTIESIESNIRWMINLKQDIAHYLKEAKL